MLFLRSPFDIRECLMSNMFHRKSFDIAANDVTPTRPDSLLYSGHGPPPHICLCSLGALLCSSSDQDLLEAFKDPRVLARPKASPHSCRVIVDSTSRSVQHRVSPLLIANTGVCFIAIQKNRVRNAA